MPRAMLRRWPEGARLRFWIACGLAAALASGCSAATSDGGGSAPGGPPAQVSRAAPRAVYPQGVGEGTGGCPVFPSTNQWNENISKLPVDPRSNRYIAAINASSSNHYLSTDFGSNPRTGTYRIVGPQQPKVPVHFSPYGEESDPGPYPIPRDAPVELGPDHHLIILQNGTCRLYELFAARYTNRCGTGSWDAGSGAVFDLRSNRPRPKGWLSADAAGLPIFPGLARADEVATGRITHALRFTVAKTQAGYIHPAEHSASTARDPHNPDLPPMGLRLRLKASFNLSRFHGQSLVILTALRTYGMIVADNGQSWAISGVTSPRWSDANLAELQTVPGSAFEVVKTGPIHHAIGRPRSVPPAEGIPSCRRGSP